MVQSGEYGAGSEWRHLASGITILSFSIRMFPDRLGAFMNRFRLSWVLVLVITGVASSAQAQAAPTIDVPPASVVAAVGERVALTVQASGSGSLTYQWRKYGAPLVGATAPTLTIDPVELADAGFYDVAVKAGGSSTTSASAEVRVVPPFYPDSLRLRDSAQPRLEATGGSISVLLALPDGRFYAGGSFARVETEQRINLARFHADGSLDATFAPPPMPGTGLQALARQADGKLIVAGSLRVRGTSNRNDVVRLNEDGSLDSTFTLGGALNGAIKAVAIQADGRILIGGGFTKIGDFARGRIARLNSDGSLDATFTTGDGFNSDIGTIGLQSDGRILAVGGFGNYGTEAVSYGLARLKPDGTYDPTFAFTASPFAAPAALTVLPNDHLLIGLGYGSSGAPMLVQTDADGGPEITFDLTSSGVPGELAVTELVARQADGRVLVSVFTLPPGYVNFSSEVLRFNPDGSKDATYVGGRTGIPNELRALAVAPDGGSLFGGSFTAFAGAPANGLVRLDGDGARDSGFAADIVSSGTVLKIVAASGGGWWVGGGFTLVNGTQTGGLVRLTADGALDAGFAVDPNIRVGVYDLVEQGDGRVIVAGMIGGTGPTPDWGLARFGTDGQRDASYKPAPFAGAFSTMIGLLADGSAVASGQLIGISGSPRVFARVLPDGTIDTK